MSLPSDDFYRIKKLPPYVFAVINELKAKARAAKLDIVDMGMGNPDGATPQPVVDKLAEAALDDEEYLQWYVGEVRTARAEMVESLRGMGVPQWPTQANFVLVKIGPLHKEFVLAMQRRGVLTRDRSKDPGCNGCVRVTVGTREQMRNAMAAMAEALDEIGWEKA